MAPSPRSDRRLSCDLEEHPKEYIWTRISSKRQVHKVIMKWMKECKECAEGHLAKSKVLRRTHYTLSVLGILSGSVSSVLSVLYSSDGPGGGTKEPTWIGRLAAVMSGISTALMAILTVLDPSARRLTHLNAELNYSLLERDLGVYLATDEPEDYEEWRLDAIRFQRRIDNAQAIAPPL
jgi:hypothetical protein